VRDGDIVAREVVDGLDVVLIAAGNRQQSVAELSRGTYWDRKRHDAAEVDTERRRPGRDIA